MENKYKLFSERHNEYFVDFHDYFDWHNVITFSDFCTDDLLEILAYDKVVYVENNKRVVSDNNEFIMANIPDLHSFMEFKMEAEYWNLIKG